MVTRLTNDKLSHENGRDSLADLINAIPRALTFATVAQKLADSPPPPAPFFSLFPLRIENSLRNHHLCRQ